MRGKASECIESGGGGGDEFLDPYDSRIIPGMRRLVWNSNTRHEHIVSDGIGSAPVHLQVESPQKKWKIMKL